MLGVVDKFNWFRDLSREYLVSNCYNLISNNNTFLSQLEQHKITSKSLRISTVPSRIKIFCWRCIRNRMATRDLLVRRDIISNHSDKVCVFLPSSSRVVGSHYGELFVF